MLSTIAVLINVLVPLVAGAVLLVLWLAGRKRLAAEAARARDIVAGAEGHAARLVKDAERDADSLRKEALLDAREKAHQMLVDVERQSMHERQQAATAGQALARRDTGLTARELEVTRAEADLRTRAALVDQQQADALAATARYTRLVADGTRELERLAGLTAEEAKALLLTRIEADARHDAATLLQRLDAEARETAADRARHYITEAIQRTAAERTVEATVSVVDLPSDDMKGRIIGREGRNIRALELATGVDFVVDDTPGAIILSGFDPYRREVARMAIERLIADGRIHPARIEEVVQKVKEETEEAMRKEAAAVAFELGLHDLHPEILRLMGRLKYRTSYGQNVLNHSAEVARLAGIMARELGLDAHVAVRAAFLHDVGKAIDRDLQGTHLELGIEFLRKHGEKEAVVLAVAAHHMDIAWPSLEAMLVQAADAISAARPGARREAIESYVKRLETLEGIADSFRGVSKSFALQAGREIRIMVESEKVSDEDALWLSKDIARRIEHELQYPGQIKVTVIRETRAVDYAK